MSLEQIKHLLKLYRTYIDDLRHYLWFDEELNNNTSFSWHKEQGDITKEYKL